MTICLQSESIILITIVFIGMTLGVLYLIYTRTNGIDYNEIYNTIKNKLKDSVKIKSETVIQQPHQRGVSNNDTYPEKVYHSPRYDQTGSDQVGFIYNGTDRFPLYQNIMGGRYYYHIIDESRNGIRITIDRPRKNIELDDGETVTVPELNGDYTARIYTTLGNRYYQT